MDTFTIKKSGVFFHFHHCCIYLINDSAYRNPSITPQHLSEAYNQFRFQGPCLV